MQGWVEANAEGKVTGEDKQYPALGEFRADSPSGNPQGPGAYFMGCLGADWTFRVRCGWEQMPTKECSCRRLPVSLTRISTYIRGNNPPSERVAQPPNLQLMITKDGINYRYLIHMAVGKPDVGEMESSGTKGFGPIEDYEVWKTVDCHERGCLVGSV